MFKEPTQPPVPENSQEKEKFSQLASQLEEVSRKVFPQGDPFISKFTKRLREGDVHSAKIFLDNESDKFRSYGEDAIILIINTMYGGSGSPWMSIERKIKDLK